MNENHTNRVGSRGWPKIALVLAVVVTFATIGAGVAVAHGNSKVHHQRADVMEQGGGDAYTRRGAHLRRTDHSLEVSWNVRTPRPESYTYPKPDMVPPGASLHPPIEPGHPEVFTLWLFVFDNPEECSDGVCDGNDVGDTTAARGSVYQLDGEIAYEHRLRMDGKIRLGQAAANGLGLANPEGADVHVAMAPHGTALDGADLIRQLNSPVGNPTLWWAAVFPAP